MGTQQLLNTPQTPEELAIWSLANQIDHNDIIQRIAANSSTVASISLVSGGSGYSSPPDVTIGPPNLYPGTQATATAQFAAAGSATSVDFIITNPGLGYNSAPPVTLSGGGGSGLAAEATVNYVMLTTYQVDPIPPQDLESWLNIHAQLHTDMLNTLGIQSSQIDEANFDDPEALKTWMRQHWQDHINVHDALGF